MIKRQSLNILLLDWFDWKKRWSMKQQTMETRESGKQSEGGEDVGHGGMSEREALDGQQRGEIRR